MKQAIYALATAIDRLESTLELVVKTTKEGREKEETSPHTPLKEKQEREETNNNKYPIACAREEKARSGTQFARPTVAEVAGASAGVRRTPPKACSASG